jgi:hypothetical protein
VENAFISEYPKLLRLFNDLLKRLRTHMEVKDPNDESRLAFEQQLIGALAKFEHQYLSRSLTHLFDPINHIFAPGRAAPVSDDVVLSAVALSSCWKLARELIVCDMPSLCRWSCPRPS